MSPRSANSLEAAIKRARTNEALLEKVRGALFADLIDRGVDDKYLSKLEGEGRPPQEIYIRVLRATPLRVEIFYPSPPKHSDPSKMHPSRGEVLEAFYADLQGAARKTRGSRVFQERWSGDHTRSVFITAPDISTLIEVVNAALVNPVNRVEAKALPKGQTPTR